MYIYVYLSIFVWFWFSHVFQKNRAVTLRYWVTPLKLAPALKKTARSEVPWTLPHHSWTIWVWAAQTPDTELVHLPLKMVKCCYDIEKNGRNWSKVNASISQKTPNWPQTCVPMIRPPQTQVVLFRPLPVLRKLDPTKKRPQDSRVEVAQLAKKFERLREQRFLWGAALLLGRDAQV